MATVKITDQINSKIKSIKSSDKTNISIKDNLTNISLSEKNNLLSSISTTGYANAKVEYSKVKTSISQILPFKVKFINIGIESYGPNNPPPIGIAVIGFNNYIL